MTEKYHDYVYLEYMKNILDNGKTKKDRTGTGTISLPFQQMRFDISDGTIPLLTTKKVFHKGIIYELLWFLKGDTNIKYLNDNGVHIWDHWANSNGDLGDIYGAMWRRWRTTIDAHIDWQQDKPKAVIDYDYIDQIERAIDLLRNNPSDRRIIVNAWNPELLPDSSKTFEENIKNGKQALPPCHAMFQFWSDEKSLSCHLYQRSVDSFLGLSFNIAQYSILLHMIAHITNHSLGEFVWTGGDCHIYLDHIEQVNEQLRRKPFPSPYLKFNRDNIQEIEDFEYNDFNIINYKYHPIIKAPISI